MTKFNCTCFIKKLLNVRWVLLRQLLQWLMLTTVAPTLSLTLILILILSLPWAKNPTITLTLNLLLLEISSQEQLSPQQMLDHHIYAVKVKRHSRDHVVRCRGSQECGSRFVNFACNLPSSQSSTYNSVHAKFPLQVTNFNEAVSWCRGHTRGN